MVHDRVYKKKTPTDLEKVNPVYYPTNCHLRSVLIL